MANKVTAAKPKTGGAIYVAPAGTTVPTDAVTALDAKFKSLGYISDAGVANDNSLNSNTVKAWGGDEVLDIAQGRTDTFQYTLIEALNEEVLKQVFGPDNVNGTIESGLTVKAQSSVDLPEMVYVVEMILKEGILKRVVIPQGKVIAVGTIEYSDSAAIGYETTIKGYPDSTGMAHYEYMKKSTAANG